VQVPYDEGVANHIGPESCAAARVEGEAQVAKVTSLVVKIGALLATLYLPTQFALDLQLLGGLWILQTFPAVVFGLFVEWFTAPALLLGWLAGFLGGTWLAWSDGLKPVHTLAFGDSAFSLYVGLLALALNIAVAVVANAGLVLSRRYAGVCRQHGIRGDGVGAWARKLGQ
jgi:solute:Na+ symporter, SSS family